ncbi:VOC family protein [Kutzneria kofuensis]|uniref:Putative enzyme related to lactoylglutathione lyase n=1 Tax=Kutzneria kofuensis TaxID=103725 RepID=A0A7W9KJZ4_9PSEU|nr:VOC family protein [Kutzneria kofuensis]MBB5893954.1 putative enzyme related to lactoylglutathione lyase [Kutzneria kofuensis]
MTDPFEDLLEPVVPVDPDPRFAASLRALLEAALLSGGTMPATAVQGDVVYASVWSPDATRAGAFYSSVLGWRISADGRSVVGLGQHLGLWSDPRRTTFLSHAVSDMDAAIARVRAAGGSAEQAVQEPFGLSAMCVDNQGLPFALHLGNPVPRAESSAQGEIVYLTMFVRDSVSAREFYGSVFGWTFTPGRVDDGWQVQGPHPMFGLQGGHPEAAVLPMYAVDDVHAAVSRVRAAGGTATDPVQMPYGITSDCVDDQGLRFYLGQF